ncbi:MAG: hypothetical protein MHM6MM_006954, partial [Cercozoa sp. M6MM]
MSKGERVIIRRGPREQPVRRFTKRQYELLELYFQEYAHPNFARRREIAEDFGVAIKRVSTWFQNRRQKAKRDGEQIDDPPEKTGAPNKTPRRSRVPKLSASLG